MIQPMASPPEMPDPTELYAAASRGEPGAFDLLLERYLPVLHAFVRIRLGPELRRREASMDVVQSVCRQVFAAREVFDFRGEECFRAWLFSSALNKIREKHRFHQLDKRDLSREVHDIEPDGMQLLSSLVTPSQEAMGKETAAALAQALAALPEEHREVISLARIVGLPHRVIAEVMDRSEAAVRQLLGRALVRVTRELRARGVDLGRGT